MSTNGALPRERMLSAAVRVPQHVVFREFPAETVVLNLDSGTYHSIDPVGGRFLQVLQHAGSVQEGLGRLQAEFEDQEPARIETDLCAFCAGLAERGLIEIQES